jgi:hypothetical protein
MAEGESSGLKLLDAVLLVGGAVIAVVVAFAILSSIVGLIWFLIKAVVVVAIIGALGWFLLHRRA